MAARLPPRNLRQAVARNLRPGSPLIQRGAPASRPRLVPGQVFVRADEHGSPRSSRGESPTVEVLSPSAADRGRKMRTFARYGVPEYWIVDPALERIEIHVLDAGACRLAQAASPGDTVRPVLPAGLTFDAARVFLVP